MEILDDAGRAALKVGDEVLVRVTVACGPDHEGELRAVGARPGTAMPIYFCAAAAYALLPRVTIAAGDKLRRIVPLVHGQTYTCVGFTQDGQVVAEYDAGDKTSVVCADASCWERVS